MKAKSNKKTVGKIVTKIEINSSMQKQDIVSQEIHSNTKPREVKNLSSMLLKNKNHQSGRMIDKLKK